METIVFESTGLTEPVLLGKKIIVGDRTGYLHIIAPETGALIGRVQLSAPVDIAPAVSGNTVYVMTRNGQVSRYEVRS